MKNFIAFICSFFLFVNLNAQNCNDSTKSGEATFYGGIAGSSGGNCSLPVAADDFMHCALNNSDYDTSNACGACLEVSGTKGKTIVRVVDRCPECKPGDVDLTQQAFEKVANTIDGRVPISWKFVPCPLNNKTIKVNFKNGSSKYWTAIQFRDIKYGIVKMEYRKNGNWVNVNRKIFNFFIEPAGIDSPMELRITSAVGEQLILDGVNLNLNADFDTKKQFSVPENCTDGNDGGTGNVDPRIFKKHTIPGRIEVEDFDNGGQGVAYNDTNTANSGGQYRTESVDIQTTGDSDGNFNVGWTADGEWLEYTVEVGKTDNYTFSLRTASVFSSASIQLSVDGNTVSNAASVANTGNRQAYTNLVIPDISISEGKHIVRISINKGGVNLNYFTVDFSSNSESLGNDIFNEANDTQLIGYPNPTNGIFNLSERVSNWEIFSLSGKILKQGKGKTVDLTGFSKGNYFVITETKVLRVLKI